MTLELVYYFYIPIFFLQITVSAPDNWAGRFWPRTWCDPNSKHCLTGDCGNKLQCNGAGGNPPVTLVEITLKGWQGLDYYDISLVDGFNIRAYVGIPFSVSVCHYVIVDTKRLYMKFAGARIMT